MEELQTQLDNLTREMVNTGGKRITPVVIVCVQLKLSGLKTNIIYDL
jgi:hypothetical protein